MGLLILVTGLVLFLGMHAVRIPDEQRRAGMIARWGKNKYRGIYTVLSITGLVLIVYGYGQARLDPIFVWSPPAATRHIAALLMLFSMILLAACYVPMNHIKARLQHPMTLAVKVWALAHLLSNGTLADILLFGSFLAWAVLLFKSARKRAIPMSFSGDGPTKVGTMMTVVVGVLAWLVFAAWLHVQLIGVSPFSR
ncbi:putative membrane protein [Limnobacter thiooxidans]|uniref:NnrU family protein n=1 Tax=Limnobacter thiooxidans TaxID=131080 RepID=A0AA86J0W8_9BURK|nr:NnrU family protein [Limnobacter sp.]MCZ8016375.1 NnrU family protein [Limnobacter sp.]RZS39762.1 putative membrane protein [Limnobacter thiooxidans]BET24609.1 NnrU family protein [Limnobacter thiooxidans]